MYIYHIFFNHSSVDGLTLNINTFSQEKRSVGLLSSVLCSCFLFTDSPGNRKASVKASAFYPGRSTHQLFKGLHIWGPKGMIKAPQKSHQCFESYQTCKTLWSVLVDTLFLNLWGGRGFTPLWLVRLPRKGHVLIEKCLLWHMLQDLYFWDGDKRT